MNNKDIQSIKITISIIEEFKLSSSNSKIILKSQIKKLILKENKITENTNKTKK